MRSPKKLLLCALAGATTFIIFLLFIPLITALLIGFDVAVILLLIVEFFKLHKLDANQTRLHAAGEDPGLAVSDIIVLGACTVALIAIGFDFAHAAKSHGLPAIGFIALGIVSVVASWSLVHTVFMLHYARLHYQHKTPGVDFCEDKPTYVDFAYLSFTVGMTYQVSDTTLRTRELRRATLHHAMISYFFGTVIVALTINLVASFFN